MYVSEAAAMNKCEGVPGWECGRQVSGLDQWCIVHGDGETRKARWASHGKCKDDFPSEQRHAFPVATPRDLVLALQGELL